MNKLEQAFQLFDAYNKQDPETINFEGSNYPAEYFYALHLHEWVRKLQPQASEALLLASRSQHIGRWKIPRDTYPAGKAGYLTWRKDLAAFHAKTAAEILLQVGYREDVVNEVKRIIQKENLRSDEAVQTMENALCLVFLQYQFDDFIKDHDDEKIIRILQKTWRKMNEQGRDTALTLSFSGRAKQLLDKALAPA